MTRESMESLRAAWLAEKGYTVAGFARDLYEGAHFFKPASYFPADKTEDGMADFLRFSLSGEVLQIFGSRKATSIQDETEFNEYDLLSFVYKDSDGNQIPTTLNVWCEVYFMLPEDQNLEELVTSTSSSV